LEFPVVFLAGMEDDIFPSGKSNNDPLELSEERRLAYVAITRAKEKIYITYADTRTLYGKTIDRKLLSRFIKNEVPSYLIETDIKREEPPRGTGRPMGADARPKREAYSSEFTRRPEIGNATPKRGAARFGIEMFSAGTRVSHSMFGAGTIVSSRDMGGDVLYEVAFDNGQTKKLLATYANLKKL
jgi:DNA helicase-2/ATP-dependent DNA helicase PcrA